MVKALHHFMFVKPSTLHYPCIIHRQNQCHKYRQNHPFPMIFSWGFIGNGRNVSICSPVARRGSTADRVDWQGRLRVTALRQSVLRQTIFKQGQHYNKPEGPADPAGPTGPTGPADKPTNMQNSGQAQQTILQKLGRQLGVSWSSPAGGHPSPGHIATPASSPTPTTSTTPPTPPPLVQPRPAGTKHRQRTPAAPSLVGTDSC